MLNIESIEKVNKSILSDDFRKPLYESYCFSNIPQTIIGLLTGEDITLPKAVLGNLPQKYDKVIALFIDAFGWTFFQQYFEISSVLKHINEKGVVSKLTSQFPSTTAAHVTSMHTGMEVGQHGVYEWNYYEPQVDAVIQPLFFSYAGDIERGTLSDKVTDPTLIFPSTNIYRQLSQKDILAQLFLSKELVGSPYNDTLTLGTYVEAHSSLAEGFANLVERVRSEKRGYYYFYYGDIDAIGHTHGPNSLQFERKIEDFLKNLEILINELEGKSANTLLLLFADHGQVGVQPEKCIYINIEFPELIPMLKKTNNDTLIIPAGSPRDFFLHIKDEYLQKALDLLVRKLQGKAKIYLVGDLIKMGVFGKSPLSKDFLERVGNVVIMPFSGESVWWYESGTFGQKYHGLHGGLAVDEVEIPLCLLSL